MFYNTTTCSTVAACFCFLVVVMVEPSATDAIWPIPPKVTVVVRNALLSRDKLTDPTHDIGLKIMWFDQSFSFRFRPFFASQSVLYYCWFQWTDVTRRFDIYDQSRDAFVCTHECNWHVLESGPCLHNPDGGPFDQCYPWKNNTSIKLS
ncbi:hypothetical protein V2J09_014709 [Rumex salicifolius]